MLTFPHIIITLIILVRITWFGDYLLHRYSTLMTGQAELHAKRSNLGNHGSLAQIPPQPTAASQRSSMAQGHADVPKCFICLTAIQHKQSVLVLCFASFGLLPHSSRKFSGSEVWTPTKHVPYSTPSNSLSFQSCLLSPQWTTDSASLFGVAACYFLTCK